MHTMNSPVATRADIDEIKDILRVHDTKFDKIDDRFNAIDSRFDAIDSRFEKVDERFDSVEAEHRRDTTDMAESIRNLMEDIDERFAVSESRTDARFQRIDATLEQLVNSFQLMHNKIDGFLGRIDTYETENAVRDTKYTRLSDWAHRTGDKTGIHFEEI